MSFSDPARQESLSNPIIELVCMRCGKQFVEAKILRNWQDVQDHVETEHPNAVQVDIRVYRQALPIWVIPLAKNG